MNIAGQPLWLDLVKDLTKDRIDAHDNLGSGAHGNVVVSWSPARSFGTV
jgi:hypothetical protein